MRKKGKKIKKTKVNKTKNIKSFPESSDSVMPILLKNDFDSRVLKSM